MQTTMIHMAALVSPAPVMAPERMVPRARNGSATMLIRR